MMRNNKDIIKRILIPLIIFTVIFTGTIPVFSKEKIHGIDVSHFNGDIDWEKVRNDQQVGFAIIRTGGRYGGRGNLFVDSRCKANIEGAISNGIPIGAYFWTQAMTVNEAIEEADFCVSQIKGYRMDLPVVVDVEYSYGCRQNRLGRQQRTNVVKAFCERIKFWGYTPMVYMNLYESQKNVYMNQLPYKRWIAQYYYKCTYPGAINMWQYTSKGRVDGINGNVDLNWLYTKELDFDQIQPIWKEDETGWKFVDTEGNYPKSQWKSILGDRYYFDDNGNRITGLQELDGKRYYFDNQGRMASRCHYTINGIRYYFKNDGSMATGWTYIKNHWYLYDNNGLLRKGLVKEKGKTYFFNNDGTMATGWVNTGKNRAYFRSDGSMAQGWVLFKSGWKYFKDDGSLKTGWLEEKGNTYYFDENGKMVTGLKEINGKKYLFGNNGVLKEEIKPEPKPDPDPEPKPEPKPDPNPEPKPEPENKRMFYKKGHWYLEKTDGSIAKNCIREYKGVTYFFNKDGSMAADTIIKFNGKRYLVRPNGSMAFDTMVKYKKKWYLFRPNGSMASDCMRRYKKHWYMFDKDGHMYSDTKKEYKGITYNIQKDGVCWWKV